MAAQTEEAKLVQLRGVATCLTWIEDLFLTS